MKDLAFVILIMGAIIGIPVGIFAMFINNDIDHQKAECIERGGQPAVTYGTHVICFAPGTLR